MGVESRRKAVSVTFLADAAEAGGVLRAVKKSEGESKAVAGGASREAAVAYCPPPPPPLLASKEPLPPLKTPRPPRPRPVDLTGAGR